MPARIVVLASGTGSLLEALLNAATDSYPARIVAVGVDRPCRAQQIAENHNIPSFMVDLEQYSNREQWDKALTQETLIHQPDYIVSAGFMKILGAEFLTQFQGRTINTHPALLPSFPGAHAVSDALAYGVKITGCTVHLVDVGVDTGPILAQQALTIDNNDDEQSLHERIKTVERTLLVEVLASLVTSKMTWVGRKVTLG